MNLFLHALQRPFVWLWRIRHQCGYGVHSPFAFDLITQVIYERTPYYKYKELKTEQRKQSAHHNRAWRREPLKVKRLLFRLVNRMQPHTLIDAGKTAASALYLKAGKDNVDYTAASQLDELFLEAGIPVDFAWLHDYKHPHFVEEVFCLCADRAGKHSLFVIEGIGYSRAMRALWKRIKQDERTGITFNLYDVGLVFFDKTKIKQHYIVNF
ncbi:MAG: hypothetical protein LBM62_07405 [Mediterranea sp.]|jgi:hypothetical protein|nr:hypothetical protein [Mediterranea sp.]